MLAAVMMEVGGGKDNEMHRAGFSRGAQLRLSRSKRWGTIVRGPSRPYLGKDSVVPGESCMLGRRIA
jgi:hypothetical protein